MPKIPSLQENVRINQGSPVEAVSAREAGQPGRDLAGLGQDMSNFAMKLDVYNRVKANDDRHQRDMEYKNLSMAGAQESEIYVRTNPEAAPDGSSVQSDFDTKFDSVYSKIAEIQDPAERRRAKAIADQTRLKYKQGLIDYQINKYNQFSEQSLQKAADEGTMLISNDPSKFQEVSANYDKYVSGLANIGPDAKAKLIPQARKQFAQATVHGLSRMKSYNQARKALTDPAIGGHLNEADREKLLDEVDRTEYQDLQRQDTKEALNLKKKERERKEQREQTLSSLYTAMFEEGAGDTREVVIEQAQAMLSRGVIKMSDYNALTRLDEQVMNDVDEETEFRYVDRMHLKQDVNSIHDDIVKDVNSGNLKPSTAGRLVRMLDANKRRGGAASSKEFNARLKNGQNFIKAQFAGSSRDIFGNAVVDKDKQADYFNATRQFNTLVYEKGLNPEEAAQKVLAEFDPRALQGTVPGVPRSSQGSPEAIKKYIENFQKNMKKSTMNKQQMADYVRMLKGLKEKMDVLEKEKMKKEMGKAPKGE